MITTIETSEQALMPNTCWGSPFRDGFDVATEVDLEVGGFHSCHVSTKRVNIVHLGFETLGPFCRLVVEGGVPTLPGVYSWTKDQEVMYIGKAAELKQIVHGARMQRAYNDYTYIPPSKAVQPSNPRVRVNALLNAAICEGARISWWWRRAASIEAAALLEADLIFEWDPPWNRARSKRLAQGSPP